MTQLMKASHQWATRPADERFLSLDAMLAHFQTSREQSRDIVSSRRLNAVPDADNKGILITGPNGQPVTPTNYAFGQIAQLAEAPAGYLRTLPAPIAADCVNYGLQFKAPIADVAVLLQNNGSVMRSATGPRYGRIWNKSIVAAMVDRFGDGVTGDWRVPGIFGRRVEVTKRNTTLFAGDRDMFVFLDDEDHRIEIPNRRNGRPGSLARGFFCWNSEVGAATFGLGTFLFDYVCRNRIVWGAEQYGEIKIRHTASAPDKFLDEMRPALELYATSSSDGIVAAVKSAQAARLHNIDEFLAKRFGSHTVESMKAIHVLEEGRPIESVWDAATAATAYARGIVWQSTRIDIERKAGDLLGASPETQTIRRAGPFRYRRSLQLETAA